MDAAAPVTLFYSYAHEDEALRDELQGHLKLLQRRGLLALCRPGRPLTPALSPQRRGSKTNRRGPFAPLSA